MAGDLARPSAFPDCCDADIDIFGAVFPLDTLRSILIFLFSDGPEAVSSVDGIDDDGTDSASAMTDAGSS